MKNLKESLITEAKQIEYRVSLVTVLDKEDLPISVSILIDKDNQKSFEKWLEEEEGNLFLHADGGNVEY